MKVERGFTLLELLVVVGIIGILSFLGLTNYSLYTAKAAYRVIERGFHDARTNVEGSISNPDVTYAAVNHTQRAQGAMTDPAARAFLPTFRLPKNTKIAVFHDPGCETSACTAQTLQLNHCAGKEYIRWFQYGDGVSVTLDHVAGSGCS